MNKTRINIATLRANTEDIHETQQITTTETEEQKDDGNIKSNKINNIIEGECANITLISGKEQSVDTLVMNNNNITTTGLPKQINLQHSIESSIVPNLPRGNICHKKKENEIRFDQNINSLRPKTMDKWKATVEKVATLEADVIGLCETSTNWNINKTTQIYKNILQVKFKQSALNVAKTRNNKNLLYLPGGSASATISKLVNRIQLEIKDKYIMGRWTGHQYGLGEKKKLIVITAY
jgi:hypothetical protein